MRARNGIQVLALAALIAIAALLGGTSPAYGRNMGSPGWSNHDTNCTSTIGGVSTVTKISGDVTVPSGASCTLEFVNVSGNVTVQHGGSLLVSAYIEPSNIGGSIEADGCASTLLEGNVTVNGNVLIGNCTGKTANGFQGPGVLIAGDFLCHNNAGPCEAWLGDINHDVLIQGNGGAASDVSLNTISGNLACQSNTATPTHIHGFNWVTGQTQGQCGSAFSTATTSIGAPEGTTTACSALLSLATSAAFPVPNTVITSATDTAAGSGLPERCIVNGSFNTHTSLVNGCVLHDNFQVQLPLSAAWNGRFFVQGDNGGTLPAATGANSGGGSASNNFGIVNGYVVADDNEGYLNSDLLLCGDTNNNQYYEDPEGSISNAYQSQQVTALVGKYLTALYYGKNASRSYMGGCSGPGREAMMWSQTFPQYFDGIFSGDPLADLQTTELPEIWAMEQWLHVYDTAEPPLVPTPPATVAAPAPQAPEPLLYPAYPAADQSLLETALLQACDALDGVADGVIDNVALCQSKFNPVTATYTSGGGTYPLQCSGAKNATCLTPAQIQALKLTHTGARTSDGRKVYAPSGAVVAHHADNQVFGYLYDGGWGTTAGLPARDVGTATGAPTNYGSGLLQFVYSSLTPAEPTFDPLTFNFNTDLGLLTRSMPSSTVNTSVDISKFADYGHKIIYYHSASDPGINAMNTVSYYNGLEAFFGHEASQEFSRMYLIPNMGHCEGGAATDQFDMLTALTQWVEKDVAPTSIPATGVNFTSAVYQVGFVSGAPDNAPTTRNRPLCPYPQEARFTGSTTVVNGVPVAATPADLGVATNYKCVTPSPSFLEKIGTEGFDRDHHHDGDHDGGRW